MRKLIQALFSKSKADLLATLVLHPEQEWFLSDLAKRLKVTPSSLQRELARLSAAEIITRRTDGKRVYYQAHERCPVLSELQGLFLKTSGLVDVVADSLRPLRKRIDVAVIFGSVARAEELSKSDVDLLVIGSLGLSDLSPALKRVEGKLKREVQVFVYTPEEFWHKSKREEHFMTSILNSPLLPVIGDIHAYIKTARS